MAVIYDAFNNIRKGWQGGYDAELEDQSVQVQQAALFAFVRGSGTRDSYAFHHLARMDFLVEHDDPMPLIRRLLRAKTMKTGYNYKRDGETSRSVQMRTVANRGVRHGFPAD